MSEFLTYCFWLFYFYNTTIKEEIEELQAAVPWTKVYIGELTKTTTSIPFITGVPNNFVGLYIDYEIQMKELTEINFFSLLIIQEISLGKSFDDIFYLNLFNSREANASKRIIKDKIYLFKKSPIIYSIDSTPYYDKIRICSYLSSDSIYMYNNITSTLKFTGADYVSSASVKVYKLLAN